MSAGTIIVGTGQAGFELAESLRAGGYNDAITLIGEETQLPYQRPPLSKGFVLDKTGLDEIELRPQEYYPNHNIELLVGTRVVAIDRKERRVELDDGRSRPYEWLVLAIGARNRRLAIGGSDLDGVLYLRTLEESTVLKARLGNARHVTIIGGGFIGLEVAAVARTLGKTVTVLEMQPRLMPRVVAPEISAFYEALHSANGVKVLCGAVACQIVADGGKIGAVALDHGGPVPADLVVVGIGVQPNVEPATTADLPVDNGIVVDEYLRTADPRIFAIGDCAAHPNPFAGARIRLESVQNAADQGRSVAAGILGDPKPYNVVPWFWTDQYDVRLQMAGLSNGYDQSVMRGDPETKKFSMFYFKGDRLVAVDSVNRPADHIHARRLLAVHVPVTPKQAADGSVDLKSLGR